MGRADYSSFFPAIPQTSSVENSSRLIPVKALISEAFPAVPQTSTQNPLSISDSPPAPVQTLLEAIGNPVRSAFSSSRAQDVPSIVSVLNGSQPAVPHSTTPSPSPLPDQPYTLQQILSAKNKETEKKRVSSERLVFSAK